MVTTLRHSRITAKPMVVAGADIDPSLCRMLTEGDQVMVEVNGKRIFSDHPCPLVAEHPWIVESNNPPKLNNRTSEENKLVLSHVEGSHKLVLNYGNLINLPRYQPAVFLEKSVNLSETGGKPNSTFIILQMVSHWTEKVEHEFPSYNLAAARMVMSSVDDRSFLIKEWGEMLLFEFRTGPVQWRHKSVLRLARRAHVRPQIIESLMMEEYKAIESLDLASLLCLHEAIYWLPMFLGQSRLIDDGHASVQSCPQK